ncbi:hypothetical protein RFI_32053 [Reticulomyxa filosa]|uniref:Endonuclease/exonuclease/phosphatase domain-containing protein n=1 Tax=Reticulomyxa filosa TaxID=46433 RepID=X6LUQ1_RETFI|nr:hypothetical protein RFI_32053 [Reticulomyxa filosa]|eukprot:ETO05344.1 hypothetical protein RFI_32053 [Reticulomyxa filosa]
MSKTLEQQVKLYPRLEQLPATVWNQFSVTSFNMLTKKFEQKDYYQYVNEQARQWSFRCPKLVEIIDSFRSDIICLQEVFSPTFVQEFGNVLKCTKELGFQHVMEDTTHHITCCTLFDPKKFAMVYHEFRSRTVLVLLERLTTEADEKQESVQDNKEDVDTGCSRYIFVVNVHLEGSPDKWSTRFAQIKSVLSRISFRLSELVYCKEKIYLKKTA